MAVNPVSQIPVQSISSLGITPVSQVNQKNLPSATVAAASPALYAAAAKTGLSEDESRQIENWAFISQTHKKLMGMTNAEASNYYNTLSDDIKSFLQTYYKVDYANKPEDGQLVSNSTWRRIFGMDVGGMSVGDALKSPFRALFAGAEQYTKMINTGYNVAQMQAVTGGEFYNTANAQKAIDTAFNGKELYNPEYVNPLKQKYGEEKSFIAMKLLAGMTPGEIIDAWGPGNQKMLDAMGEVFNNQSEFSSVMAEFERAQISPGRTATNTFFKSINIDQKNHPWLHRFTSGTIDAAWQVLSDPLTYMTGGLSAIVKGTSKLSKGVRIFGEAGSIAKYFADPTIAARWNELGKDLSNYRKAADAGDDINAGKLMSQMRDKYQEFDNTGFLDFAARNDTPITDAASAQEFFQTANNANKLMSLRVNGIRFYREGMPVLRTQRSTDIGIRVKMRDMLQGKTDFADIDGTDVNKIIKNLEKIGDSVSNKDATGKVLEIVDKYNTLNTKVQNKIRSLANRHPGNKEIYTSDEKYMDTVDLFREQANIALNNRQFADILTAHFINLGTEAERIALRKALDEVTLRRIGLDKVSGGESKIQEILSKKYGYVLHAIEGDNTSNYFSATPTLRTARNWGKNEDERVIDVRGTLLPFQNSNAVGALPWREISNYIAGATFKAGGRTDTTAANFIPRFIGGAFNHSITDKMTDTWTLFTLAPRLGIRTAIDEGFMYTMYLNGDMLREFWNARRSGKVLSAYLGSDATTGPVKNYIVKQFGKVFDESWGAPQKISQEVRDLHREELVKQAQEGLIPWDKVDVQHKNDIFDMAINAYGKKLPESHKLWLREIAVLNPHALESATSKQLINANLGRTGVVGAEGSLLDETALTRSMAEHGAIEGDYKLRNIKDWTDKEITLAMYHNFYLGFGTKPYKFKNRDNFVSPAELFIKYNGLRTKEDYDLALQDFMEQVGFKKDAGVFVPVNDKLINEFLGQSRQNISELPREITAEKFIEATFSELYYRFHGSDTKFNEALFNRVRKDWEENGKSMGRTIAAIDFDSYQDLVRNHRYKDSFISKLEFNTGGLETLYGRFQEKTFEMMSKQTDSLFRQPVIHSHYFVYRKKMAELEQQRYKEVLASLEKNDRLTDARKAEIASDVSSRWAAEHAMDNAINHTLKYSDNPDIRSALAWQARSVGRFYRAVEDFQRRMYRTFSEKGLQALYRARLMSTGLSAFGATHTDENGQSYLVMPMDDQMFHLVDSTLRSLSNGKLGVEQPLFNDITFKLSAGNPSFQDDAGVPYLSGPAGSLSVLGVQSLLGKFDVTKNLAEDLDNLALGNIGDNVDLRKAILPKGIDGIWKILTSDERNQQEISAAMQAIAYNKANGYGVNPLDKKYVNADGTRNEALYQSDVNEYLDNIKISAHNIIFLRNVLGLISPISPSLKETKDLPDYLKDNGVSSIRASFYDVLDDVERMYPDAGDPYEIAIATWTSTNRGKLAYLPSRNNSAVTVAMNYSNQMQNWIVANKDAVDKYGTAAVMFAPNIGEFSPGVYNWAKAAELIDSKPIGDYLNSVLMQEAKNAYYDLNDAEVEEVRSLGAATPDSRRNIISKYSGLRKQMLLSVPFLEQEVSNVNNEDKLQFLNNAYAVNNDKSVDIKKETRDVVNQAFDVYNNFITSVEKPEIANATNSAEVKRFLKAQAFEELKSIAEKDSSGVVKELIRNSFTGLMNAKSRDGRITIR